MITRALRSRRDLQAALAVTAVALLSTSSGVCAAPVEVTDYAGLVGIVGANDDYKTGERFNRYDPLSCTINEAGPSLLLGNSPSNRHALRGALQAVLCRLAG